MSGLRAMFIARVEATPKIKARNVPDYLNGKKIAQKE